MGVGTLKGKTVAMLALFCYFFVRDRPQHEFRIEQVSRRCDSESGTYDNIGCDFEPIRYCDDPL